MKVLFINGVCGFRSTGKICADLADRLEETGHEAKIAYGRESYVPEQYQKYAVRIGKDIDLKLHAISARLFDNSGFGSVNATKIFLKGLEEYNPDIIHLHNIHGYYVNIELLFNYLKRSGKRVLWTLHDGWAFAGHSARCDMIGCERWKTGCYKCPKQREYPKSYIDRSKQNWEKKKELFTNVRDLTIITPSYWLASEVQESFLSNYPVTVIHNGIDTTVFRHCESDFKKRLGLSDKKILLGVSTAWDEMKGLSDYYKLADIVGKEYQVILVGLTDDQKKKLPYNVIGITRTNSVQELVKIYSVTDVHVNLSYCDTYPTVNIEAAACGVPTVSYRTGGSPEFVVPTGGLVVNKGDINAVAQAIKTPMRVVFDRETSSNKLAIYKYICTYKSLMLKEKG